MGAACRFSPRSFRNGWGGPQVERDGEMQPRDLEHPLYVSSQSGSIFPEPVCLSALSALWPSARAGAAGANSLQWLPFLLTT
jgi:hypothetical protein